MGKKFSSFLAGAALTGAAIFTYKKLKDQKAGSPEAEGSEESTQSGFNFSEAGKKVQEGAKKAFDTVKSGAQKLSDEFGDDIKKAAEDAKTTIDKALKSAGLKKDGEEIIIDEVVAPAEDAQPETKTEE